MIRTDTKFAATTDASATMYDLKDLGDEKITFPVKSTITFTSTFTFNVLCKIMQT